MLRTALIQLSSGADMGANIAKIESMVAVAAGQGAQFVALPENAFHMDEPEKPRTLYTHDEHPGLLACAKLAHAYGCFLLAGTVAIRAGRSQKSFNRSVLFDGHGKEVAHYDKIHLFDVNVGDGQTYRESERIKSGEKAVLAKIVVSGQSSESRKKKSLPNSELCSLVTKLGLTVCYDLRFPQLFRTLAKKGAQIITVPSAFTEVTGRAHWHVLLRARAIENGCFIVAPAQCGTHPGKRKTYGHSLVVDPWGKIIAEAKNKEGVITADLDLSQVEKVRKSLPSLAHDRDFR